MSSWGRGAVEELVSGTDPGALRFGTFFPVAEELVFAAEDSLFVADLLSAVVVAAQRPLHVPQAVAWQLLCAVDQPELLCLTVAESV